jgi:glycosyltransferase involved in cell wall biosynthesis
MTVHCYVSGGGANAAAIAALHPAWTVKATKLAPSAALNRACKAAAADIVVLIDAHAQISASLDSLLARLDGNDILLLARQPDAGDDFERDLHIARTGTFNLGFLAVRTTGEGPRFAAWWADRVAAYPEAVDEAAYLDQRWCDLVPGLFGKVAIERRVPAGLTLAFDRVAA